MAKIRANPKFSIEKDDCTPAVGWKVYFYEAGTSTPKDTYSDYTETVANTNPIILDARGEADVWASGAYKCVVTDENDVEIWTVDNWGAGEDIAVSTGSFNIVQNGSFESDAVLSGEPDNWEVVDYSTGTHEIDATDQFYGLNSLKFTSIGAGGGYATSEYFEVQEGRYLSTQFAIRSTVGTVRNVVDIIWYTAAKTLISTTTAYDDSTTNPTSWTFKKSLDVIPSTARYAKARIYGCHSSDATTGSTWFDNIVVSPLLGTMGEQDYDAVDITGGDASFTNLFLNAPVTVGTGSAYTATLSETVLTTNRIYSARIHTDNIGACTLTIDGLATNNIKLLNGSNPYHSALTIGMIAKFHYDGTNFVLINPNIRSQTKVPAGALYLGSEIDGAKTVSVSENLAKGEYHYTSLTIDTGQVLGCSDASSGFLVIRCSGQVTLSGTASINLDEKGGAGGLAGNISNGNNGADGNGGGSGGGGGSSLTYDGGAGGDSSEALIAISGGVGGIASDGDGGNGVSTSNRIKNALASAVGANIIAPYGAGGGSGGANIACSAGKNGGGSVIIIADSIVIESNATISCNGGDSNAATGGNCGGIGAGGGGTVMLLANYISNSGTITVSGGAVGTDDGGTSGSGGGGGDGYSLEIEML